MSLATVEVTMTLSLEVDDAVVDEVMSDEWRRSFYTFRSRNDALAWLAWVVNEYDSPQHVDGLAGFTDEQIKVRVLGQDMDVVNR